MGMGDGHGVLKSKGNQQGDGGWAVAGIIGSVTVAPVAVFYGGLYAYANYVYNNGQCLKFKIVGIIYYPGSYGGSSGDGYCR